MDEYFYKVIFPDNMREGEKYPVIYVMHGLGSNEEEILGLTEEFRNDFIIIGIRGSIIQGSGYAYFSIKGYGNPDRDSFLNAVKKLEAFINQASSEYPVDKNRQFLLGFSQGAILSMTLALIMGNKIKGIAALSGYIPQIVKEEYEIKPLEEVSVFISHGEFDPIFPIAVGNANYEFFKERSRAVSFKTYSVGHEVAPGNKADMIEWMLNTGRR